MLREAVKQGTPVGREAEGYMKRGELVPDSVMIRLVEERLDRKQSGDGCFMFDGFPRTLAQAELLDETLSRRGAAILRVFFLDAPRDLLISRLAGRRICRNCGANYHVVNIPPKKPGVCDQCGGDLYQRPDDQEATIANRLDVFRRQTQSLIDYYDRKGILVRVDSARPRDVTVAEIVGQLSAERK